MWEVFFVMCSKCGYENPKDALICEKCSTRLLNDSKLPGLKFVKEGQVNEIVALFIIVFGILSIVLFLVPIVGGMLYAISGIMQLWLMFQWVETLNTNIDNSLNILEYMSDARDGFFKSVTISDYIAKLKRSKIEMFWFWVYVLLYIFGGLSRKYAIYINLGAFVFLGVFLQMVFNSERNMQSAKNHFYSILLPGRYRFMNQIKRRNFFVVMLFSIITMGIYWYYLLIKHSSEINAFIKADQENRGHLI